MNRIFRLASAPIALLMLAMPAHAILIDMPDPVGVGNQRAVALLGTVMTCIDNYGNLEVYEVVDESAGQFYSVFILKQIGGPELRAAWNAQLGRTIEAVNTYISSNGGAFGTNKAFEQGQTGTCGEFVGFASCGSCTYRVKVDFGGMDYTYETSQTTTLSFTVEVRTTSKFEISLTNAGVSQQIEFGISTTWTATTTTTVTVQGTRKIFISNNISGGPGPVETIINSLT